jgi:hypothetical protein
MPAEKYYWILIAIAAFPPAAICTLSYSSFVNSGIILNIIGNFSYPLLAMYLVVTTLSLFCYFAMKLDDKNRTGVLLGIIAAIQLLSFVITAFAGVFLFQTIPPVLLPLIAFVPFLLMLGFGSIIVEFAPPGLPSSNHKFQNDPPIDPIN